MAKKNNLKKRISPSKRESKSVESTERLLKHTSFSLSGATAIKSDNFKSSFVLLWETLKDTYMYRWRTFFFVLSYGIIWYVLAGTNTSKATASIYSIIFGIIASLAAIWMIRHREAGERVTIRLAYYEGMVQLIPYCAIVFFLTLQLLPAFVGFYIFQTTILSGAVVSTFERSVPGIVWLFLSLLSLYWTTATLMSMYVVTIPYKKPIESIRIGRSLVDGRRWFIIRKVMIGSATIVLVFAGFAYWFVSQKWDEALQQLSVIFPIITLPIVHTYLYKLYKSLLEAGR